MTRICKILIIALLAVTLGACGQQSNFVHLSDLSGREEAILSAVSDQTFVFDFQVESESNASIWIEKYENGNLVANRLGDLTGETSKKGSIFFTAADFADQEGGYAFTIGIWDKGGAGSVRFVDEEGRDTDESATTWQAIENEAPLREGETTLAASCISNDEDMSSFSSDFFEDTKAHKAELGPCDISYVLKADFVK